jgi:hypothetical protein
MFTVHDLRQVGMPTLATVATAESAWKLADFLGLRPHACVLPARDESPRHYWEERDEERSAHALSAAMSLGGGA